MASRQLPLVSDLRRRFHYNPLTGRIIDKATKEEATGAKDQSGYKRVTLGRGLSQPVQRVAWAIHYGKWPSEDLIVDHIDRDRKNNRLENLRLATRAENMRNRTSADGSSSKYLGVSKHHRKWKARIKLEDGEICLGSFDTEEQAAIAYDCAAVVYHRDFASLNFITNPYLD